MLERFTDDALLAIASARQQARELGHGHVGSEHLLLGLLATDGGVAATALLRHEVTLRDARHSVCSIVTPSSGRVRGPLPFTATAKRALEWSVVASAQHLRRHVLPEDVMLGVIHADGTAVAVLAALEVDIREFYDDLNNDRREPDRALVLMRRRAATALVTDMLRVGDDVTTVALEALVASWAGNADDLEAHLGALVRLIDRLGHERWLAQLSEMIEIIDANAGELRIRPKPEPEG